MLSLLLLACSDGSLTKTNTLPEAQITSPADGSAAREAATLTLRGAASDANHTTAELLARWFVDDVEICASASPESDGTTACAIAVPAPARDGSPLAIRLEVIDPDGAMATASVALVARTPEVAHLYHRALEAAEVSHLRRVDRENFDSSPGVDVTDIFQIKGLEYDYIVLLEVTSEHYPDQLEARHLLHVGATRAAHQLWLVCSGPPSPLLPSELLNGSA
jgi:hypothetical protein